MTNKIAVSKDGITRWIYPDQEEGYLLRGFNKADSQTTKPDAPNKASKEKLVVEAEVISEDNSNEEANN